MRTILLSLLIAVWFLPSGCAHSTNPGEALFKSAKAFNEHIRWKRFQLASKFLPVTKRDRWLVGMQAAGETLRIVDYRMAPVKVGAKKSIVDVFLASYRINNPTIQRQRRRQYWTFNGDVWLLEADKRLPIGTKSKPKPIPQIGSDEEPWSGNDTR